MIAARNLLNYLIKDLHYTSFCEIGYANGGTIESINLPLEQKVSVDPSPDLTTAHVRDVHTSPGFGRRYCKHDLRLMTSDRFFETNERQFDLFLIDGDHSYEQVYRDIQNSLKFLSPDGVIFCHDAAPLFEYLTLSNDNCGDGYKALLRLRTEENDLSVYALNEYITQHGPHDNSGYGIIFRQYQEPWKDKLNLDDKNFNAYKYMKNNKEILSFIKFKDVLELIKERNRNL